MKINFLETHDRLKQFHKQDDLISQGCEECIKLRPEEFGNQPFYIFAHQRTIDMDEKKSLYSQDLMCSFTNIPYQRKYKTMEDVPSGRLIWEPRLTKPKAQENSMLFKAYPPTDHIKVIWIIPARELWGQFEQGDMIENLTVYESIRNFHTNREMLEAKEDDDLDDARINAIFTEMSNNARYRKGLKREFFHG